MVSQVGVPWKALMPWLSAKIVFGLLSATAFFLSSRYYPVSIPNWIDTVIGIALFIGASCQLVTTGGFQGVGKDVLHVTPAVLILGVFFGILQAHTALGLVFYVHWAVALASTAVYFCFNWNGEYDTTETQHFVWTGIALCLLFVWFLLSFQLNGPQTVLALLLIASAWSGSIIACSVTDDYIQEGLLVTDQSVQETRWMYARWLVLSALGGLAAPFVYCVWSINRMRGFSMFLPGR